MTWHVEPGKRVKNPRAATDAQQITSGNASAIVAMVPICTATLMAMVPLEVFLKDLVREAFFPSHDSACSDAEPHSNTIDFRTGFCPFDLSRFIGRKGRAFFIFL